MGCRNCSYFAENLLGLNNRTICLLTHKEVNANDSCIDFRLKSTFDDLKNPEK